MLGEAQQHDRLEHHRAVAQVGAVGEAELAVGQDPWRAARRERARRLRLARELIRGREAPTGERRQALALAQQLLTYLKLADLPVGMVINFEVERLFDGVKRVINPRWNGSEGWPFDCRRRRPAVM